MGSTSVVRIRKCYSKNGKNSSEEYSEEYSKSCRMCKNDEYNKSKDKVFSKKIAPLCLSTSGNPALTGGLLMKDYKVFKRFHFSQTKNAIITSINNNEWHLYYAIVPPDPYITYTQDVQSVFYGTLSHSLVDQVGGRLQEA